MRPKLRLQQPRQLPEFHIAGQSSDRHFWTIWFPATEQSVYVSDPVLRDQQRFRRHVMWDTDPAVFICVVSDTVWDDTVKKAIQEFEVRVKERKSDVA